MEAVANADPAAGSDDEDPVRQPADEQRSAKAQLHLVNTDSYIGRRVSKHSDQLGWVHGKVARKVVNAHGNHGNPRWTVEFDDGDVDDFSHSELKGILGKEGGTNHAQSSPSGRFLLPPWTPEEEEQLVEVCRKLGPGL